MGMVGKYYTENLFIAKKQAIDGSRWGGNSLVLERRMKVYGTLAQAIFICITLVGIAG